MYRCASIDIGVVNLAFCVTEFTPRCDGAFDFNLVHTERTRIGGMDESIHCLGKKLLAFYDRSDALRKERLDYVFVEQQLSRAVKNTALSFVTMAYFETRKLCESSVSNATVVFVSPRKKFQAVRHAFPPEVFREINFERRGRELKRLSVEVARLLFTRFRVKVGLVAMAENKQKLDDISDVFLQSFAFFLHAFPPGSAGCRSSFIGVGVEENGKREDPDEKT